MPPVMEDATVELPGIDQLAFVVDDIEVAMDQLIDLFGVGPWERFDLEPPDLSETEVWGQAEEFGFKHALADVGDMMIDLSEPQWGRSVYQEHLDEHGPGPHHVAYFSWDEDEVYEVVADMKDAGIEVAQSGVFLGSEFWYFDTREQLNGLMFETVIRRNVETRDAGEPYP